MRNIFTTRRRIIIAGIATAAVLGTGGAAFAYFAGSGTGSGTATVGSAATWNVSAGTETGGPLFPDGSSSEQIVFTVANASTGDQEYTNVQAVVAKDPGNGYALDVNGNDITGCDASWFTPSITSNTNQSTEIDPSTSGSVTVTVTMPANETVNQTACAGKSPKITLNVS